MQTECAVFGGAGHFCLTQKSDSELMTRYIHWDVMKGIRCIAEMIWARALAIKKVDLGCHDSRMC